MPEDIIEKRISEEDLAVPEEKKGAVEKEVDEIAEELQIKLPQTSLPWPIRIIALLTLVGGLSALGGAFADIFSPTQVSLLAYTFNLVAGSMFIAISYGIVRKQRWAVWLYGLLALISLIKNPILAILPLAVVVFLYIERDYFRASIFDSLAIYLIEKTKEWLNRTEEETLEKKPENKINEPTDTGDAIK